MPRADVHRAGQSRHQHAVGMAFLAQAKRHHITQRQRHRRGGVAHQFAEECELELGVAAADLVVEGQQRERLAIGVVDAAGDDIAPGLTSEPPSIDSRTRPVHSAGGCAVT